jgi:PAS domain S-box-containing protein
LPAIFKKKEERSLEFDVLPSYIQFILDHRLEEFVTEQLQLSSQINVPLLQYFKDMTEEQMFELSLRSSKESLTWLANNKAKEQIGFSIEQWKAGRLPQVAKDNVVADDLTLIPYVKKKTLMRFLPEYAASVDEAIAIVNEIDKYFLEQETRSFNVYIDLLFERIDEHVHLIEKINNTSPAIIYVYDIVQNKEVYTNHKLADLLGYSRDELTSLGSRYVQQLRHADDAGTVAAHKDKINSAKDGEIIFFEQRLRDKQGEYRWIRNYESVFKRDTDNKPTQVIGVALMIDNEKQMAEALAFREEQLLEAQELADMGSFDLNLETGTSDITPQVYRILGLQPGTGIEGFLNYVHPADKERVRKGIKDAIDGIAVLDEEYRYFRGDEERIIWSRGNVSRHKGVLSLRGTVMDVTQRHHMVQKLQHSDQLYKEAQALTHIGNWTWLIEKNRISWSDEMYRIFGLQPQQEAITAQHVLGFVHPSEKAVVIEHLKKARQIKSSFEQNIRIVTREGELKILQVKAQPRLDENGSVFKFIGTCQDITEKQLLIEKLEASDNLYKQAQALSHIGNWTFDVNTRLLRWSDELFSIYNMEPREEISIEEAEQYTRADDRAMIERTWKEQVRNKKPHDIYLHLELPNGVQKVVHSRGEVVLDKNGKVISLVGTAQDVTEQKRVEKELLDQQTFIKKIADATPSIIASYNINTGKYTFVSEGLTKLLGYSTDLVLEKGVEIFADVIHPEDLPRIMQQNMQALEAANTQEPGDEDKTITEFVYRMKNARGAYRWFHTYGTVFDRNAEGKVEHILNISLDITDKIEAEQKLREQENFNRHIAEASPTILYLYHLKEKKFIYVNKEVKQVLGYTPEEILQLGSNVTQMFLHPEDEINNNENHVKYKKAGGTTSIHQYEGRIKDKAGNWKWLLTREIVFERDENGAPTQVIGSALDITMRKEMEQALVQKTIQLQQSNANLEEFAHIASHDLQEPLRKISTFGDRLLNGYKDTLGEDGTVYLDKMIQSSHRMQQLINDILSISLVSSDKSFRRCSLQRVVDDVLQTLDLKIERTKAQVHVDPLPEANIIASQMRQLFQNLLSNSLKFISKTETPHITIKHEYLAAADVAKYQLKKSNTYLKVTIADNGIGFDDMYAEKIFSIFQRLHGRSEYEGTGIGLSICRKIVENHDGVIFASSPANGGAVFTFIIPA